MRACSGAIRVAASYQNRWFQSVVAVLAERKEVIRGVRCSQRPLVDRQPSPALLIHAFRPLWSRKRRPISPTRCFRKISQEFARRSFIWKWLRPAWLRKLRILSDQQVASSVGRAPTRSKGIVRDWYTIAAIIGSRRAVTSSLFHRSSPRSLASSLGTRERRIRVVRVTIPKRIGSWIRQIARRLWRPFSRISSWIGRNRAV